MNMSISTRTVETCGNVTTIPNIDLFCPVRVKNIIMQIMPEFIRVKPLLVHRNKCSWMNDDVLKHLAFLLPQINFWGKKAQL